jgi:hypothetical protein
MEMPVVVKAAIPWRRLMAEFLVIVASVMVALAADRWTTSRDDQTRARAHLAQLRSDFERNEQIALASVAVKQKYAKSAAAVLDAVQGTPQLNRTVPFPVDVELAGWNHAPSYLSEAWNDLLSTGDVRLITNGELRNAVAAFYQQVNTVRDREAEWSTYVLSYRSSVVDVLDPYLRLRILELYPDRWSSDSLGVRASDEAIVVRLRRSVAVGGKLADIIMAQGTAAMYYDRDVQRAREIVAIIDRELALNRD